MWLGTQILRWDAQRGSEMVIVCDCDDRPNVYTNEKYLVTSISALTRIQLIVNQAKNTTLSDSGCASYSA